MPPRILIVSSRGYGAIAVRLNNQLNRPYLQLQEQIAAEIRGVQQRQAIEAPSTPPLSAATSALAQPNVIAGLQVSALLGVEGSEETRKQIVDALVHPTGDDPSALDLTTLSEKEVERIQPLLDELNDIEARRDWIARIIPLIPPAIIAGSFGTTPNIENLWAAFPIPEGLNLTQDDRNLIADAFTQAVSVGRPPIPTQPPDPTAVTQLTTAFQRNRSISTHGAITGSEALIQQTLQSIFSIDLPTGMTNEEAAEVLRLGGYTDSDIETAQNLRLQVDTIVRNINREHAQRTYMTSYLPRNLDDLEQTLANARWERMKESPALALLWPFQLWSEYLVKPLVGFTTQQLARPSLREGVGAAGTIPAILLNALSGRDEEEYLSYERDFNIARDLGIAAPLAHSYAYDNWDAGGLKKFVLEVAFDPLTYIGFGLYPKLVYPFSKGLSRSLAGWERSFNQATDTIILAPIKAGWRYGGRSIGQLADQRAHANTRAVLQMVQEANEGRWIGRLHINQVQKAMIASVKKAHHRGDGSHLSEAGRILTHRAPLTRQEIIHITREILPQHSIDWEETDLANRFNKVFVDYLHPPTAGVPFQHQVSEVLSILGITPTREIRRRTEQQLVRYKDLSESEAIRRIESHSRVVTLIAETINRSRLVEQKTLESEVFRANRRWNGLVGIFSYLEAQPVMLKGMQLARISQSIARTYLYFGAYGLGNILEGFIKIVLDGLNPVSPFRNNPQQELAWMVAGLNTGDGLDFLLIDDGGTLFNPQLGPISQVGRKQQPLPDFDPTTMQRYLTQVESLRQRITTLPQKILIDIPSRVTTRLAASHVSQDFLREIMWEHPQMSQDITTVLDRLGTKYQSAGLSQRWIQALKNRTTYTLLNNPDQLLTMHQDITPAIFQQADLHKMLAEADVQSGLLSDTLGKYIDSDQLVPQLDRIIAETKDLAAQETLVSSDAWRITLRQFANEMVQAPPPTTQEELLTRVDNLIEMQQTIPENVSDMLRVLRSKAEKNTNRQSKSAQYDDAWNKDIIPYLQSAEEALNEVRDALTSLIDRRADALGFPPDHITALRNIISDISHANEVYAKIRNDQLAVEQRLIPLRPEGADLFSAESSAWWDNWYRERNEVWTSGMDQLHAVMNRIYRARVQLGEALPNTPQVQHLTLNAIAHLFHSTPDQAGSSFFRPHNRMIIPRKEWVNQVYSRAQSLAESGQTPESLGWSRRAIGRVYDESMEVLYSHPDFEAGLSARTIPIDDFANRVRLYLTTKGFDYPENFSELTKQFGEEAFDDLRMVLDPQHLAVSQIRRRNELLTSQLLVPPGVDMIDHRQLSIEAGIPPELQAEFMLRLREATGLSVDEYTLHRGWSDLCSDTSRPC